MARWAPGTRSSPACGPSAGSAAESATRRTCGWHERLFAPVVVKVVRPDLVDDCGDAARPAPGGRDAASGWHTRWWCGPSTGSSRASGRTSSSSTSTARGCPPCCAGYGPLSMEQLLPLGLEMCSALHYLVARGGRPPRRQAEQHHHGLAAPADRPQHRPHARGGRTARPRGRNGRLPGPGAGGPATHGDPRDHRPTSSVSGATLYEALTGARPFRRGQRDDGASAAQDRWPQLVEATRARCPGRVPDVVATPRSRLPRAPTLRPGPPRPSSPASCSRWSRHCPDRSSAGCAAGCADPDAHPEDVVESRSQIGAGSVLDAPAVPTAHSRRQGSDGPRRSRRSSRRRRDWTAAAACRYAVALRCPDPSLRALSQVRVPGACPSSGSPDAQRRAGLPGSDRLRAVFEPGRTPLGPLA